MRSSFSSFLQEQSWCGLFFSESRQLFLLLWPITFLISDLHWQTLLSQRGFLWSMLKLFTALAAADFKTFSTTALAAFGVRRRIAAARKDFSPNQVNDQARLPSERCERFLLLLLLPCSLLLSPLRLLIFPCPRYVPRRSEFTEFVTDHVFGNVNGMKPVCHVERRWWADKFGENGRASGPGLNDLLALASLDQNFHQMFVTERTFFNERAMFVSPFCDFRVRRLMIRLDDFFLALRALDTQCDFAPGGHRRFASDWSLLHRPPCGWSCGFIRKSADGRANAEFAFLPALLILTNWRSSLPDFANRRPTIAADFSHFAAWEANDDIFCPRGSKSEGRCSGGRGPPARRGRDWVDVVNESSHGNFLQFQSIPDLDVGAVTRHDFRPTRIPFGARM